MGTKHADGNLLELVYPVVTILLFRTKDFFPFAVETPARWSVCYVLEVESLPTSALVD